MILKPSKNKKVEFKLNENNGFSVYSTIKFNLFNTIPYLFNNKRTFWTIELEDEEALIFQDYMFYILGKKINENELYMCDCHEPSHFFIINKFDYEDYININITVPITPLPFKKRFKQFFKTLLKINDYHYHYHDSIHHIEKSVN
jgi:hypothetical protein